ncbi:acyl-CoA thioesterase [Pacificimonas sp. ICDLI1SI03]
MTRTAEPVDIDELGHVNNAVYVRWIQDVATAHWFSAAPAEIAEKYVWVVVRHEIDYRAPTVAGETVTLATWVGSPKGARFDRFVEVRGADARVRVAARTFWAMLDRNNMRPLRIGPDITRHFGDGAI